MSRKRLPHTLHFIYKTTCTITGRYYYGMHSTSTPEDGYIGSGNRLWHSIRKHGKENHIREIIEYLPDRTSLIEREKEIVTSDLIKDAMCMNIVPGGAPQWRSPDTNKNISESLKGRKLPDEQKRAISEGCKGKNTAPKSDEHRKKLAEANIGKVQTEETKEKRAEVLREFYATNPRAEESRKLLSEKSKAAWEKQKEAGIKRKRPVRKKFSMTPGAIKMREHRIAQGMTYELPESSETP